MTAAEIRRNELVEANLDFVRRVAEQVKRKLPAGTMDLDDLFQEGVIGLMTAASKYDSSQNDNFEGYAYPRVRGAMLDSLRRRHWYNLTAPQLLDGALPPDPIAFDEAESDIERNQRAAILERAEDLELKGRELLIVIRYYHQEQSEAAIALALAISESRVGQIRRHALAKLRYRCRALGLVA